MGRHLVNAALARNHEITLFNRGKHSSAGLPAVEQIHGDRNRDLDKLKNRAWDAVIDTCGYLPQPVKASAEALKNSVNQYVFVSSISAYADFSQPDFDETAPVARLTAEQKQKAQEIDSSGEMTGAVLGEMYGALKVLCEEEAERAMPNRVLQVRAGLIVGSYDPTDRFTYWVMRVSRGGEVLAPGNPDRFIQFIDARDLSEWIIKMIERGENGVFNVNGLPNKLTMAQMLEQIKTASRSDAFFTFVSEDFLQRENVQPWGEMPLWLPEKELSFKGFLLANVDKAVRTGLTFRPLGETVEDILSWRKANFQTDELKAGICAEREQELLHKWRETV